MSTEGNRDYWDEVGHKLDCPVWGDDWMTEPCTCGSRPAEEVTR